MFHGLVSRNSETNLVLRHAKERYLVKKELTHQPKRMTRMDMLLLVVTSLYKTKQNALKT